MASYQIRVKGVLDTKNLDKALEEYQKKVKDVKFKVNVGGNASKELKDIESSTKKVESGFGAVISKVAQFGLAAKALQTFERAVKSSVDQVFELDDALTQFKKVSDLSGDSLARYVDEARELGSSVARTGSEIVEAATAFRKNGFNDEDSLLLSEISSRFQNVADTEISAADSASFIISQMKAFKIEASDAASIIDATNEVANRFSVGTNDLSKGLTVAGAAMSTYGNDFNQTIALLTAGTEIMVGKSAQVARGLNTIAGRLVKNADLLKQYGVEVTNSNGELNSTYEILTQLAPAWEKMSDVERVTLGETLSGVNQYKVNKNAFNGLYRLKSRDGQDRGKTHSWESVTTAG